MLPLTILGILNLNDSYQYGLLYKYFKTILFRKNQSADNGEGGRGLDR